MGRDDVLIRKLEEALAGLEGAFAGVWSCGRVELPAAGYQNLYRRTGAHPRGN
jgi:hypothetical protein